MLSYKIIKHVELSSNRSQMGRQHMISMQNRLWSLRHTYYLTPLQTLLSSLMFKYFRPFQRLFSSRLPLLTLTLLPFYILKKQKVYALDAPPAPILQNITKPKELLPIQYADTIPNKIAEYDDKNVIVYFMSGNPEQDDLVQKLLIKYKGEFNENIHVIFIKHSLDPSEMPLHTFLTKRNYSKDIGTIVFKSQLDNLVPEEFINTVIKRLDKNIHKLPEINKDSLSLISNSKTPKVFLKADKNSPSYSKHRILFQNFMEKPFAFKKVEFMIVTDEEIATMLGIDASSEGSIHMMVPSESEFLKADAQNQFLRLGNHEFALVKQITNEKILKDNFIFVPFMNHATDHTLELKVNNNKMTKEEKQNLFEVFKDFPEPIHITYANIPRKYQFLYSQHDDLSYKILKEELPHIPLQEKINHLTTPKQWLYTGTFQKQEIRSWVEKVKNGEVQPYYKSEPTPKIDIYSHRLTGKNFQQILVSTDNEVVFFYSENCHNCGKFGEVYEDIARSNYSDDKLVMNHVNIEKNEMECGYNTPLTPSLSFFKLEAKTRPFTYDLKLLSKDAINNFIDITRDVKLVDDELFNKFISSREGYNYQL